MLADYLGCGRIAFVEWPEAAGSELAGARIRVTLAHAGEDRRRIEVLELRGRSPSEPRSTGGVSG